MEKRRGNPMELARKALRRKTVGELVSGEVLGDALNIALQQSNDTDTLEHMAYNIEVMRQITIVVSQQDQPCPSVIELAHNRLGPALQPRGVLGSLILEELANPSRPHPQRAAEALTAAAKLATALPAPQAGSSQPHLLAGLFQQILADGFGTRCNLVALSVMVDYVPEEQIPSDLLERLLDDFNVGDGANVRCVAIASLLRRTGGQDAFRPLLRCFESDEEGAAVRILGRYLLEALFKNDRRLYPTFLKLLDQPQYFEPWITTAAYGISNLYLGLEDLPAERLKEAIAHEDHRVRIMAFELAALNKRVLDPAVIELVKESLRMNAMVPHPGARTDMGSAIYAFLQHLSAMELAAAREQKRPKPTPEAKLDYQRQLEVAAGFHTWLLDSYLTPSIQLCQEPPSMRAIFALKNLKLYLEVFGGRQQVQQHVFTPERIRILVSCQACEFSDARLLARHIIGQAPLPLPGYASLESTPSQVLLASAKASINHPRNTQAEAGRAALCIMFSKLVQPAGPDTAVAFVQELANLLESHIVKSEANLASGIAEYPLHGPLSALTEIVRLLKLTSAELQTRWQPLLRRLFELIKRVWALTSRVVALGVIDPSTDTAAHEIAKAYEILGDGDDEGEDMDHTNLLSGSWRATRAASELLAAIMTAPLVIHDQILWTKNDINDAGLLFLTWMHEVRHRGTFSRIAPALAQLVVALKEHAGLRDLVSTWLEHELDTVAQGHLSTLRRSAALPYSFLSLVTNDPKLLDRAVDKLLELAHVDARSADETKVHAMNCLKILLLDTKHGRFLSKYLERTLMTSIAAFGSANWNVRNVGLLVFSSISDRSLQTPHSQTESSSRAALSGRHTLAYWHGRHPSIIPYIKDYLRASRRQKPASLSEHSPLFPSLIILRNLRWSVEGAELANELFPAVEPYLGSVEWQVREVASQALSSLLSPQQALEKAKVTATRVSHESSDLNTTHGRLLFLRRLISEVVEWSSVDRSDRIFLELRLRDALQVWTKSPSAVIPMAVLECVNAFAAASGIVPAQLVTEAAMSLLRPSAFRPGQDLLHVAAAKSVLLSQSRLDVAQLLSKDMPEDVQLVALERVQEDQALRTPEILQAVIMLCSPSAGDAVCTSALEAVADWPRDIAADSVLSEAVDRFLRASRARCVPLREAALGALGRAAASATLTREQWMQLANTVPAASDENQSEPRRAAALRCLAPLPKLLFGDLDRPTRAVLQKSLLRLLEDDDLDLRAEAADVVSRGLNLPRPVVQDRALELWWTWLGQELQDPFERALWEPWLWATAMDESGLESILRSLEQTTEASKDVLFVEEPPNMFRNPLTCAAYAAAALASCPSSESSSEAAKARQLRDRAVEMLRSPLPSPIDPAWPRRESLALRVGILDSCS